MTTHRIPAGYAATAELLQGRIILVTGATRGIGRAAATAFARHGATVILHGRNAKALDTLHSEIKELGPEPAVAVLDLERAQGDEYMALTDAIESRFGRLDGLLLNASLLGDKSPIEHYDIGVWQRVMHVNVNSEFIMIRCLLPLLRQSEDASIVLTTSGVGNKGRAFWGAYSVSKFATEGMAQVLAQELENTNIRVNYLNPGGTRTSMRAHAYPGEDPNTLPAPEEILDTYLYLIGPDSRGVNGQRFDCQG